MKEGPSFCPKTPRAILCFSSVSIKGQEMSGSIRAGAERIACLRVLKVEQMFDFSSRG